MAEALATDRLWLEPWREADSELLGELSALPEVVRYVGDGRPWSAERARDVHARVLAHWREHGFGWRVAVEKASGRAVGLIALNYAGPGGGVDAGEIEIGWWIAPDRWGRGLAGEGAHALKAEALERLGARTLLARIQPANVASQRVARGLGMRLEDEGIGRFGEPVQLYRYNAADAAPHDPR